MSDVTRLVIVKEYRWATGGAVLGRRTIDGQPRWVLSIAGPGFHEILGLNEREINRDARRLSMEPGAVAICEADGLCNERGWSAQSERVVA
jgi:hypothetical protein